MFYEVDFIPVGDGERSGDAAALRVWNAQGAQVVFVVDGGTKESGKALVDHIKRYYGTSTVNGVISTHPDCDHSSGLSEVLENLDVKNLFMHKPWDHADDIRHLFDNRALTTLGISRKIRQELEFAHDLKKIADRKNIPIIEPFAGESYFGGLMHVLGPSLTHYQAMLPHFRTTPDPIAGLIPPPLGKTLSQIGYAASEAVEWVAESIDIETLTDEGGHFSAENSTSGIVLFNFGGQKILFTGDADIDALNQAIAQAVASGIALNDLHIFDVPHHGSKHNVGPTVLNAIRANNAHISAAAKSPKHPSSKVKNALIRRGAKVYTTQGKTVCYPGPGVSSRPGWTDLQPEAFTAMVEK